MMAARILEKYRHFHHLGRLGWLGNYHVPPPMLRGMQGDYQYGFRVPLLVVSAHTLPVI